MRFRVLASLFLLPLAACSCDEDPAPLGPADAADPADAGANVAESGPGSLCVPTGQACDVATDVCCSGVCDQTGRCQEPVFCKGPDESCTSGTECCTLRCSGGKCGNQTCFAIGQSCSRGDECCSLACGSDGKCAALPPGPGGDSCGTLGERCDDPSDCCSTNCQGGVCVRAYSCQANGDICLQNTDCCGSVCTASVSGGPGRCLFVSGAGGGGCIQGGNPCPSGGTTCCSRVCVDLGSGAAVCQIAGGCRLTGEWCDESDSCCGGGANPNGSVLCREAPGRCDHGTSCNPVGNICGANVLPDGGSVNASQNCCDGRKEVCKLDTAGIPRCFGGCPNNNCPADCPTGYDPDDPNCCLGTGDTCQFRDQCCNRAPCVPGPNGNLVCGAAPDCQVVGDTCDPTAPASSPNACCGGSQCLPGASGYVCQTVFPGVDGGLDPGSGSDGGRPDGSTTGADGGGYPDAAPPCEGNGSNCASGRECCSGVCTGGVCVPPTQCQPAGTSCASLSDCCAGLTCNIPVGQTTGTCETGGTCSNAGQTCSQSVSCCSPLVCRNLGTNSPCDGTSACVCGVDL